VYCDREWNCLNDRYHEDLAAAEAQALFGFPGVVSSTHPAAIAW